MTQQEKAKAYDEAQELAKFYHGNCPSEPERKKLEKMFPELRESEDERIRKEIITTLVEGVADVSSALHPGAHYSVSQAVSWLEKQKEQKPVEYLSKDKVFSIMKKLMKLNFNVPLGSEQEKLIDEITCDVRDLLDYPIEQKPAEWSEEDEKMLTSALWHIKNSCGNGGKNSGEYEVYNWFKDLPNRFALSSWKPSANQMTFLATAIDEFRRQNRKIAVKHLTSLFDDLKARFNLEEL